MDPEKAKKRFPAYFSKFELPSAAKEQRLAVYRACRTRRLERESFLCTYEENGFCISADGEEDDPQEYCVSMYSRLKDIRRFVVIDSKFQPPYALAKGHTTEDNGVSCKTQDWKSGKKTSHIDYWLYEDAQPWTAFELVMYENEYENFPEKR